MRPMRRLARLPCAALLAALALPGCGDAPAPQATAPVAAPVAAPASAPAATASASLPADVAAFRASRESCDHFRGEEPYDATRKAEIARELDKHCKGTDARLAALRTKYAGQPAVLGSLKDFEDRIE
jgi:curli biogenesis system outer membrane secretion channel CsgG